MLFSLKIIRKNKFFYYSLMTNNSGFPLRSFPPVSLLWLKKTVFLINKGDFIYKKKISRLNVDLFQLKKFIIEISFVIFLKLIRIKNSFMDFNSKLNEHLRFFCK